MISQSHTGFSYHLVEFDGRMLLESICKKCGAVELVSDMDGSLDRWEEKHADQCPPEQTDPRP